MSDVDWNGLQSLTTSELYENLALLRGRGAVGHDPLGQGKKIYDNARILLQDAICESSKIRAASEIAQQGNSATLLAALLDAVTGYLTGVAGASFCVLLLRDGLPGYCFHYWAKTVGQQDWSKKDE